MCCYQTVRILENSGGKKSPWLETISGHRSGRAGQAALRKFEKREVTVYMGSFQYDGCCMKEIMIQ